MLLLNHPCSNEQEFAEWKKWLNSCCKARERKPNHNDLPEGTTFPGLVITLVDATIPNIDSFSHTLVSRDRLLKALGMTQAEIKMEFGQLSEKLEEKIEEREV